MEAVGCTIDAGQDAKTEILVDTPVFDWEMIHRPRQAAQKEASCPERQP
jgi:hypothetical protein